MRLIGFAIYLGIGAMLHALFIGPQFDWSSAWTFGWLFGWPIMLVITTWVFAIGVAIAVGIVWCCWAWLESLATWRERRRNVAKLKARKLS
ncbi:hypothetical protein SAMN05444159_1296 [Bradyrhizobium lablabi]|uniref:Uncharacterized protein n=1 Tax=Bradyrhizobium lablabi TaxID=722472 RepID=A0A1M6LJR0_9BRAD|nr:hypothetical protein [Bradyrhizobium lablabi]SHJ71423.1 hypothetical protein SAMN05444159_1296 [Bradyrhizobium lablabi]